MVTRRRFLELGAAGAVIAGGAVHASPRGADERSIRKPIVVSTWSHGLAANEAAWPVLSGGGRALDAVEAGVRVTESDPGIASVGYGGFPDRDGQVTLDACIMDERSDCGSVACLREIEHPTSVARLVMERTKHVMLVGQGALDFAIAQGFQRRNLLTPRMEAAWREWQRAEGNRDSEIDADNHDTIGTLALDRDGNLSGACTTSGAAWKLPGRVGDSPLIGAGLFVDNAVGGACATGWGEAVIRVVGSHLVVEFMRHGHDPQEACRLAVERVIEKNPDYRDIQVGFLALDRFGAHGSYCISPGFQYAVGDESGGRLLDAISKL